MRNCLYERQVSGMWTSQHTHTHTRVVDSVPSYRCLNIIFACLPCSMIHYSLLLNTHQADLIYKKKRRKISLCRQTFLYLETLPPGSNLQWVTFLPTTPFSPPRQGLSSRGLTASFPLYCLFGTCPSRKKEACLPFSASSLSSHGMA